MISLTQTDPESGSTIAARDVASLDFLDLDGRRATIDRSAIEGNRLLRCPLCGTEEMYVQKDFPQRVGAAIVAAGLIASTVAWAYYLWFWSIGILVGSFLVDLCLYQMCGDVLVCYRCLAQYRGAATDGREPFDLGVGERYRQERLRREAANRR